MKEEDKRHLDVVAGLGCMACAQMGIFDTPAEIHHVRHGQGMSQRASHKQTIPLCPKHHRTGGHGVAIHAGQKEFEKIYGSEIDLLRITYELLGIECPI